MPALPAAVTAAAPAPAVQPSLAEQLTAFGQETWAHLLQLDPREAGLNFLVSAGVLLFALGLLWILRRLFDRWIGRFADESVAEVPEEERRAPRAVGVTWALLRLAILGGALLFAISVWGIDPWAWLSGSAGARLAHLVVIAVLAVALVEVAGFVIHRLVEGFAGRSRDARRAAQLRTLGPLLAGSVQGVLIVVGLLTFLSELGVKVGPLLASAGVVGIAVGFGAQTLVKDFLTGLFLIAEDVVSVGDNVRIGEASGTVEGMTLRTIRLRNQNGTLHIFPYSEAQVIHNRTKVFSSYIFETVLAYGSDLDKAFAILAEEGRRMCESPEFAAEITKPVEVMGVEKLSETGVVIRARLTTRPRAHVAVGRAYNLRVAKAFADAGISSPYTTVQVMKDLGPTPAMQQAHASGGPEPRSFDPPEARPPS